MWAQFTDSLVEMKNFVPWISFIAGISGSLHCVGMCGGLVTASCERSNDVIRYQMGRLIGYLILGSLAGFIGSLLAFERLPLEYSIFSSLLLGSIFIYWGVQMFGGKKVEIPAPKFLRNAYIFLWKGLIQKNTSFSRAFFIGLISIILPCGLLYGIVLGTMALKDSSDAFLSMFFFWLGTLPSMIIAPKIVRSILKPIQIKLPKTYALTLITIGLVTITMRVSKVYEKDKNVSQKTIKTEKIQQCH